MKGMIFMEGKKLLIAILAIIIVAMLAMWGMSKQNVKEPTNDNISGDVNESGEIVMDKVSYVKSINSYVDEILASSGDKLKYDTLVTTDEVGNEIDDFVKSFNTVGAYATIEITKNRAIEIIPASDFLDIQSYYYKGGDLVLYKRDFIGIGGSAKYYFKDGEQVALVTDVEDAMKFTPERSADITKRASNNYLDFFTSDFYSIVTSDGKTINLGMDGDIISKIGKRIVSSGETKTDWESIVIKDVKYDDFDIRIVNSSVDADSTIMDIKTSSSKVKLPKDLKLGADLDTIRATLNRYLEPAVNLEYDESYYKFKFDKAYIYTDTEKYNRELIFYMLEEKLVAIEMLDALDA